MSLKRMFMEIFHLNLSKVINVLTITPTLTSSASKSPAMATNLLKRRWCNNTHTQVSLRNKLYSNNSYTNYTQEWRWAEVSKGAPPKKQQFSFLLPLASWWHRRVTKILKTNNKLENFQIKFKQNFMYTLTFCTSSASPIRHLTKSKEKRSWPSQVSGVGSLSRASGQKRTHLYICTFVHSFIYSFTRSPSLSRFLSLPLTRLHCLKCWSTRKDQKVPKYGYKSPNEVKVS